MCFKNLFHKKPPVPIPIGHDKTAILFAINNYPGSSNDLNGCLNDQRDIANFLLENYPEFAIERFSDSKVTRQTFRNECKNHITSLSKGQVLLIGYSGHGTTGTDPNGTEADGYIEAMYLYDGPFWDYEFKELLELIPEGAKVILALDSCFAGGSTRLLRTKNHRSKYMPIQQIKPHVKKQRDFVRSDGKYVLFAGCAESQTSADAYIKGEYHGAFTYYWLNSWLSTDTYLKWGNDTASAISQNHEFDQTPSITGNDILKKEIIFT